MQFGGIISGHDLMEYFAGDVDLTDLDTRKQDRMILMYFDGTRDARRRTKRGMF